MYVETAPPETVGCLVTDPATYAPAEISEHNRTRLEFRRATDEPESVPVFKDASPTWGA
jgi:hypothetical protein